MSEVFSAQWLMAQRFEPTKYVVPGIVPEGMTLLVAAPKIGKSWMVLGLAIELARGGNAFGSLPIGTPRPVLYLALEDGQKRLQRRLQSLDAPSDLHRLQFLVDVEPGHLLETIREFMHEHDGLDPVVMLDTLGKVMPPAGGNESAYSHDYRMLSALKATCDAVPGSSLIIVHHTRKQDGGDFLDAVSGTQGIAGAADTVLVLRRERHEQRATLHVTSRDAAEGEYSLTMTDHGKWELDGRSLEDAANAARQARAAVGVGTAMAELISKVAEFPMGISPKDLKAELPEISNVDEYLRRAVASERIEKLGHGLYAPVRSVSLVSFPPLESHKLTPLTPSQAVSA